MDISLKRAHFYCLLLLSHYLCAPAVGFRGGLLTVSVPQQYLVSFVNKKRSRNKNIFKLASIQEYEHCHSDLVNLCFVKTVS